MGLQREVTPPSDGPELRGWAARRERVLTGLLGLGEDLVYALVAVLLLAASLIALGSAAASTLGVVLGGGGIAAALGALDSLLLVLIFVELFYTVRLSIKEHSLAVEPILAVALIATVRRILVVAAEGNPLEAEPELFRRTLIELAVLGGLVLALVVAMALLRRFVPANPTALRESAGDSGRGEDT